MFGDFINITNDVMNYSRKNGEVISNNIANANTPDYKAKEVKFSSIIDNEMKTSLINNNEKHIGGNPDNPEKLSEIELIETSDARVRVDGNNVDQTKEMIKLLQNNNKNSLAVNGLNSEINLIATAIGR